MGWGLRNSVSAVALASGLCAAAAGAQDAGQEEIVVSGQRASNAKSIQAKETASQILDTIAADEAGKLPDFNAGAVLARITGVNMLAYQGEPRYVIVRGLDEDYDTVQIDGFAIASNDVNNNGGVIRRQVLMEMLPANLAARFDVTKSGSPDADANAIGGLVNLVTPNGFDYGPGTLTASAKGGANLMDGKYGGATPSGEAQARYVGRFGHEDQFAYVATASAWGRQIHVPQLEAGGTRDWFAASGAMTATPYGGTGYAVPSQRLWYNYDNDRVRAGLTSRVDWQPDDRLSATLSGYVFHQEENSDRTDLNAAVNSTSKDLNQTADSGILTSVNQTAQLGQLRWRRNLLGVNGQVAYDIADDWKVTLRSSWSEAMVSNPQTWDQFVDKNLGYAYSTASNYPVFTPVNPTLANAMSAYGLGYHREEIYSFNENVYDNQINLQYNEEAEARGLGAKIGGRIVSTLMNTSFNRTSWSGAPYTLANVGSVSSLCGLYCNSPLFTIDPTLAAQYSGQYRASETATVDYASKYGGSFSVGEFVPAMFLQTQYRGDGWTISGGARLEHTDMTTDGYQSVNGAWRPVSAEKTYTDFLPSIIATLDTSEESKLRFGLSRTMGRPRFDQEGYHGGVLVTSSSPATLSQGNPDLKPRLSDNLDLGHDWYWDDGKGILAVALFYKKIRDEIFTYGAPQTVAYNGGVVTALVTEPLNSPHIVYDRGIELGVTRDLDFLGPWLDGFGVSGNMTYSRAHYPITLSNGSTQTLSQMPQQPHLIGNINLYYEKDGMHARLAWNHVGQLWDDRYPNFTPAGFYSNRFQAATDTVDFQAGYDLTEHISLTIDALNMTGQGYKYRYGNSQELYQSAWSLAPTVMAGASVKF